MLKLTLLVAQAHTAGQVTKKQHVHDVVEGVCSSALLASCSQGLLQAVTTVCLQSVLLNCRLRVYHYYLPVFFWVQQQMQQHQEAFREKQATPPLVVRRDTDMCHLQ